MHPITPILRLGNELCNNKNNQQLNMVYIFAFVWQHSFEFGDNSLICLIPYWPINAELIKRLYKY